jgi:hypothetical protein
MALFGERNPNADLATAMVFGEPVVCTVCRHNVFRDGRVRLVTGMAALTDLEWLNRAALVLSCDNCSNMLWFAEHDAIELYEVGKDYER